MSVPRAALIGVTGYGGVHLEHLVRLHEVGRVRLAAATVINPAEAAAACARLEELGARRFGDYREMLREMAGEIELCCIPTGISWHRPMTCEALAAGCHVLVEKPLAGRVEDAEAMIAAAREAGRFVAVGFHDLWHPVNLELKRRLMEGAVGEVRRIGVLGFWSRPVTYYRRNAWAGRLRDAHGWVFDSPANNAMAHFLNLALFFGGRCFESSLRPVAARARLWRANAIESADTVAAVWETEEGVRVGFYGTHATTAHENVRIRVEGTGGVVEWECDTRCRVVGASGDEWELGVPVSEEGRRVMFDAVAARVRDEGQWICTPEIARAHTVAVGLLHEAAPIEEAPPGRLRRLTNGSGEELMVIEGIEEELRVAFEEVSLP